MLISNDFKSLLATKAMLFQGLSITDNNDIKYILRVPILRDLAIRTFTLSEGKKNLNMLTMLNIQSILQSILHLKLVYTTLKNWEKILVLMNNISWVTFQSNKLLSLSRTALHGPVGIWIFSYHLASFRDSPNRVHWLGVKRGLQYLHTRTQGLIYSGANLSPTPLLNPAHGLEGWSDAHCPQVVTRRSSLCWYTTSNINTFWCHFFAIKFSPAFYNCDIPIHPWCRLKSWCRMYDLFPKYNSTRIRALYVC